MARGEIAASAATLCDGNGGRVSDGDGIRIGGSDGIRIGGSDGIRIGGGIYACATGNMGDVSDRGHR